MATSAPHSGTRSSLIPVKHVLWVVFGLMILLVIYRHDLALLDSHSEMRQRFAPIPWLMVAHGVPGAIALGLGVFQFSDRLRKKYLQVHRVLGRVYVGCVAISAPLSLVVVMSLGAPPSLVAASTVQAIGWIATTATGLYCARTGRIQQHKEWMVRSYPFAMVFIFARAIQEIPVVAGMGLSGVDMVVWSCVATACFLPSFVIAWQALAGSRRMVKVRAAV
jgi:uncharacterized membrane protein